MKLARTKTMTAIETPRIPPSHTKLSIDLRRVVRRTSDVFSGRSSLLSDRTDTSSHSSDLLENYSFGPLLAKTPTVKVYSALHEVQGRPVTIKVCDKQPLASTPKSFTREFNLLKHMEHPCIMRALERFQTSEAVYAVYEHFSGVTLREFLMKRSSLKLTECIALNLVKQVAAAVAYCHKRNVTHHAISLDTILITDHFQIKLTGFEHATCCPRSQKCRAACAPTVYTAPEARGKDPYFGPPADVWSIGVLLYCLTYGHHPFDANELDGLKLPSTVSRSVHGLLKKLLALSPVDRPAAAHVLKYQ